MRASGDRVRGVLELARELGPRWLIQRGSHTARVKLGHYRRKQPVGVWGGLTAQDLRSPELASPEAYATHRRSAPGRLFFQPDARGSWQARLCEFAGSEEFGGPGVVEAAKRVLQGEFRYFTLHGFERGVVYLHMRGACAGCPSSTITLKNGIENLLRYYVPEVSEVRPIE